MFEDVVLRQMSVLRTYEFTRAWRNLRNEYLHNLCSSAKIEWVHTSIMVAGKSWRFGRRWKSNILVYLLRVACDTVDWIKLAKCGIKFGMFEYGNEPSGFNLI
jgi:hypothetical protein